MCLATVDRDTREAIAFARACNMQRGWLPCNQSPRSQAVHLDQSFRSNTSDLFVRGQHDAQAIDPTCVLILRSGQKAGQKSLHIAGATTMQHGAAPDRLKGLDQSLE